MKIQINYDLLQKIRESKTGLSLKRSGIKILLVASISSFICMPNAIQRNETLSMLIQQLLFSIQWEGLTALLFSDSHKSESINKLKKLSNQLKDINVSTSYELLKQSYTYKTNYKIKFNDYLLPYIIQNKYIMVPTYDNGEIKETSLLQEHNIGSKYYSLSHGSPDKVLKLAYGSI